MTKPTMAPPTVLVDLDFGDAALQVHEHADGMFTLFFDGPDRLLVPLDQFQTIVDAFQRIGKDKGWF